MPSKIKQFFKTPSHLLALLVSLTVVAVGSVAAVHVFASDIPDSFDGQTMDHLYYDGQADRIVVSYYNDETQVKYAYNLSLTEGSDTLSGSTLKDDEDKLLATYEDFPADGANVEYSQSGYVGLQASLEYDGETFILNNDLACRLGLHKNHI